MTGSSDDLISLYRLLVHRMKKCDTYRHQAIPARKRLMITLHWLATRNRIKNWANCWGIGKSTAEIIVHQLMYALLPALCHNVVASTVLLVGKELHTVMEQLDIMCNLPQCSGAIDGYFIPIDRREGIYRHKYWCYKTSSGSSKCQIWWRARNLQSMK